MPDNAVLTQDQQNAADAFMDFLVDDEQKYFVIQGAAGSGKTFLVQYLLEHYQAHYHAHCLLLQMKPRKFNVQMTATTNKAATVLEENLKSLGVPTLHSWLGLRVANDLTSGKTYLKDTNKNQAFSDMLLFIDEGSFINDELYDFLDKKVPQSKIVIIGDAYQLAPVGQTCSVMESLECPKVELQEVVRNTGAIREAAQQFRQTVQNGVFQPIAFNQTDLIQVDGPTFKDLVEQAYLSPNWSSDSAKILSWTNSRTQEYNHHIRSIRGLPERLQEGEVVITNNPIIAGQYHRAVDKRVRITDVLEKHMSLYDVSGQMIELDKCHTAFLPDDYHQVKKVLKQLAKEKEWKDYFKIKETWLDLRPVYASTVAKSQGSTYDEVFIDLADIGSQWVASDTARLIHVAISRARHRVICYGQLPARYQGKRICAP